MIDPNILLRNADLERQFDTDSVRWNEDLGFMEVNPADVAVSGMRLVGFGAPYLPGGETPMANLASEVVPVTVYDELPRSLKNVNHLSKGVGTRLYNIDEAARGGSDLPDHIVTGVYTLDIRAGGLDDRRSRQGNVAQQISRHLSQRIAGLFGNPERVVSDVHRSYATAEAVRLNTPTRGIQDMQRRGLAATDGITPGFVIIRNPALRLKRVGYLVPEHS